MKTFAYRTFQTAWDLWWMRNTTLCKKSRNCTHHGSVVEICNPEQHRQLAEQAPPDYLSEFVVARRLERNWTLGFILSTRRVLMFLQRFWLQLLKFQSNSCRFMHREIDDDLIIIGFELRDANFSNIRLCCAAMSWFDPGRRKSRPARWSDAGPAECYLRTRRWCLLWRRASGGSPTFQSTAARLGNFRLLVNFERQGRGTQIQIMYT